MLENKKNNITINNISVIKTGANGRYDGNAKGALQMRPWQKRAFAQLKGKQRRIIIAPTGSGKSILLKALAYKDLAAGNKVIIIVPQSIIAQRSFQQATYIKLPNGKEIEWCAANFLINQNDTVTKLLAFIEAPIGATPNSRILICTHQTLVFASKKFQNTLNDISLFIDETHHSSTANDPELQNRLGSLVEKWIANNSGPITLTTATWMRADFNAILSSKFESSFTRFTLSVAEHLESMQYLKEIHIRLLAGPVEKSLEMLFQQESMKKTIVYMPHATSQLMQHCKYTKLRSYKCLLGKYTEGEWYDTHKYKSRTSTSVDFVTEDNRDYRKQQFNSAIDNGKKSPDIIWALNLCKEGFDWTEVERSIVIGARSSIPEVIQMLGRLLRDYPGKEKVEFNLVLPNDDLNYQEVKNYLKLILIVMITGWYFGGKPKVRKVLEPLMHGNELQTAMDELVNAALNNQEPEISKDPDINSVLKGLFTDATRKMLDSLDINFHPEIKQPILGCLHVYAMQLGYKTLGALLVNSPAEQLHPVSENAIQILSITELSLQCKNENIRSPAEYRMFHKKIPNAPTSPKHFYPEWTNWNNFFNIAQYTC